MIEIVGIRFKEVGKIYYFNPKDNDLPVGTKVIVETVRGIEMGVVALSRREIDETEIQAPIRDIIRIATESDEITQNNNLQREKEAMKICIKKIQEHGLDMNLVDVDLTFDLAKIIFYFTSDGRVDFRDLVKDLASIFRMRIELRQIGVRDEAKILNGIGICGRTLCCATFLGDFQPVSIKMVKDQSLSLNPTKISGICGRLMCCLKYEEDTYKELNKDLPNVGDIISTVDGKGEILSVNVLRQTVKAAVRKAPQDPPIIGYYAVSEIKILVRKYVQEEDLDLDLDLE